MTSGAGPLLGWGAVLVAIALFGVGGFDLQALPALLLAGAGTASIAVGAAAWAAQRRRPPRPGEPELLLRSSVATLVLTVGATLAFVGAVVIGPGLLWPGLAFIVAGAGGLVREHRAARRLLKDARRGGSA
jgi:hypothetical protein